MPRILVIADDLTGAAEIGGIAVRYGLSTQLLRTPAPPPTSCDVVIYDTDSRLLATSAAAEKVSAFAQAARAGAFDLVFKKTDSVLRGEPFAEIDVVAQRFNRPNVLFVPHNPSRDRCVSDGRYTVGGVPLHQTEFARDPQHPATTSNVLTLLRPSSKSAVRCLPVGSDDSTGWVIGEATTTDDVAGWAERLDPDNQLAAGGADFFDALVQRSRRTKPVSREPTVPQPLLYLSGTASAGSQKRKDELRASGRLLTMPDAVFEQGNAAVSELSAWADAAAKKLVDGSAMIAIDRLSTRESGKAELLQGALTHAAKQVLSKTAVHTVACEGGATGAALCDLLGWRQFTVELEIAPGIVMLRSTAPAPRLIVKPGSYPWPRV